MRNTGLPNCIKCSYNVINHTPVTSTRGTLEKQKVAHSSTKLWLIHNNNRVLHDCWQFMTHYSVAIFRAWINRSTFPRERIEYPRNDKIKAVALKTQISLVPHARKLNAAISISASATEQLTLHTVLLSGTLQFPDYTSIPQGPIRLKFREYLHITKEKLCPSPAVRSRG